MIIGIDEIKTVLAEHRLLAQVIDNGSEKFRAVTFDSRRVSNETLFFCKGNFRPEYLASAKAAGATGYVSEREYEEGSELTAIIVTDIQKAMALIGAAFYGYPQNDLFIVAVTGTKGKTTTAYFTHGIFAETTDDKTALFSTVDRILGPAPEQQFKSDLTTPESLDLFHDMREAVDSGMTHLVMEVSSQAYKRNRVYGLTYDVGIFLNITPDHIGPNEHPTFEDYLLCKEQVLVNSTCCIINAETDHLADVYYAAKTSSQPENVYLFARKGAEIALDVPVDFWYNNDSETLHKSEFDLRAATNKAAKLDQISGHYEVGIAGNYNEGNAVAALIASALDGVDHESAYDKLEAVRVPGRMETVVSDNHGTIYIDYAHNYASVHALLEFLKGQTHAGRVIIVVGSPGNKGESRRAGFGQAISEEADVAVLTTDDPGYEDPMAIAKQIDDHIDHGKVDVIFELDRPTAIKKAIEMSTGDDIVVLAGKGEDPYQKVKGVDTPYPTDVIIAKEVVKGL
ncbi:UDP-N-acetylmuramoyl-L-alanyl-D-glutamate--2,6-diaminopimelate ligase [Levilactobacillus bambusae]|uniref:UDP-N-acetylmuramyl-tripeptide synthetase n=1 Tax=Levilactobacillus bambusae TaxID=2024736 RepID=A0A2V1N3S5_9LACO|nr:UDP-N-acetylmuramoyl-L-alanyl-D-glutamate--2,6-diaminopimelate ligase [Levilactobacillus bambusae]PWG01068.1 UDP-N-acetylmuramoyl-L-alanyl-D-glutamate--2,6-diaminopimelate ligase [Levilactobacillus bambusae]